MSRASPKWTALQSLITVRAHGAGDTIPVSSITIRNLDPAVKERLRIRAAQQGHSMEAEARSIISTAVGAERPREVNLAEAIRQRFAPLGGADDLEMPPREPGRDPPPFD
jgi:antitoxin FitA